MKTLEELYKEILAGSELKAQAAEAIKEKKLGEFLKAQGCEATVEEVKAFLESKKEVSVDELDFAAGGCSDDFLCSLSTVLIGCAITLTVSVSDPIFWGLNGNYSITECANS